MHRSFRERYQWQRPFMRARQTTTALVPNSVNRLGLPPFSRTSARKYLLNSQLATSGTENETGAETQPAVVSGNAPVSYWSIFPLSLVTVPEVFAKVNSTQFPSRSFSGEWTHSIRAMKSPQPPFPPLPYQKDNLVPRVLSYPSLRRKNLGMRLPKTLSLKTNHSPGIRVTVSNATNISSNENFEILSIATSRGCLYLWKYQEEEETFHSLDDIFWILNRSFSLNR